MWRLNYRRWTDNSPRVGEQFPEGGVGTCRNPPRCVRGYGQVRNGPGDKDEWTFNGKNDGGKRGGSTGPSIFNPNSWMIYTVRTVTLGVTWFRTFPRVSITPNTGLPWVSDYSLSMSVSTGTTLCPYTRNSIHRCPSHETRMLRSKVLPPPSQKVPGRPTDPSVSPPFSLCLFIRSSSQSDTHTLDPPLPDSFCASPD